MRLLTPLGIIVVVWREMCILGLFLNGVAISSTGGYPFVAFNLIYE